MAIRLLFGCVCVAIVLCVGDRVLAAEKPSEAPAVRLSTFRCDVTPPLEGRFYGGWAQPLDKIEDPLWGKGIVLDDGRTRCVLCALDWCILCNSSHLALRRKIAYAADTDVSRVAVQCVHQHTAPVIDGDAERLVRQATGQRGRTDLEWLDTLFDRLAAAVKESLGPIRWHVVPVSLPARTDGKFDPVANRAMLADANAKPAARESAASRLTFLGRSDRPIELSMLAIGDLRILHLPGEPMVEFQLFAQRSASRKFVAVAGYGDGGTRYLCTKESFDQGGCEPSASAVTPEGEAVLKSAIGRLLGAGGRVPVRLRP